VFLTPLAVGLLQTVIGAHAHLDRNDIGLPVREVVTGAWEAHRLSVAREGAARPVVAAAHGAQQICVGVRDRAELRMTISLWGQVLDLTRKV
jgi:hypothetical protein